MDLGPSSQPPRFGSEVVWGPFPLRWGRLLAGLGIGVMGVLMAVLGLLRNTLDCARVGPLAGQCRLSSTGLDEPRRFPLEALRDLQVIYSETSNKGRVTHHGQIVLTVAGRPLPLKRESRASADRNAAVLRAFATDPAVPQVSIATERAIAMLPIGGLMALMGLSLLYPAAVGRRRFRFTRDGWTEQLAVRAEWPLGIGSGAPKTVAARAPVEVEIEWGQVEDFWTSTRSPGPRGGWLQIRLADGSAVELSPRALGLGKGRAQPGYRVHLRAAEQLRQLLGCPRRSTQQEEQIASAYRAARPQPPPGWQGVGGKIAAVWIGACCGSLLGIGVSAILAVGLGFKKMSDSAEGLWFLLGALGGIAAGVALSLRLTQRPDER